MRPLIVILVLAAVSVAYAKKYGTKFHEDNAIRVKGSKLALFTSDYFHQNELCNTLRCRHHDLCLAEADKTATCVSRHTLKTGSKVERRLIKKLERLNDREDDEEEEDEDEEECQKCPIIRPDFVCGTDGKSYANQCRLEYAACISGQSITMQCQGRCPCSLADDDIVIDDDMMMHSPQDEQQSENDDKNDDEDEDEEAEAYTTFHAKPKHIKMKDRQQKFRDKYHKSKSKTRAQHSNSSSNKHHGKHKGKLGSNDGAPAKTFTASQFVGESYSESCSSDELKGLADRLLDWFHVLRRDAKKAGKVRKHAAINIINCNTATQWKFRELDKNHDKSLSQKELEMLEEIGEEKCINSLLYRCDADMNQKMSIDEWCKCFEKAQPPCIAAQTRVPKTLMGKEWRYSPGAFIPACDRYGYYANIQCHGSIGYCWCVDKHGNEYDNTRVRGKPKCDELSDDSDDVEDDDNEEDAGSGY